MMLERHLCMGVEVELGEAAHMHLRIWPSIRALAQHAACARLPVPHHSSPQGWGHSQTEHNKGRTGLNTEAMRASAWLNLGALPAIFREQACV